MLSFSLPKTCLNAVAFSPDGARLATGGTGGRVRVWTLNPPEVERTFVVPCNDMVRDLAFDADSASFLIRADGKLRAFGPDGTSLGLRPAGASSEVLQTALAPARPALAVAHPSTVVLYRLSAFEPLWTVHAPTLATALACTPDGRTIALGSRAGDVLLFRDGRELLGEFRVGIEVKTVAVSPQGDAVAACGHTHLWLWRLTPPVQEVAHVQLGKTHFRGAAWHPGGAFFATANGDGTVDYWDARSGARRESFDWKVGKLHDVTFDAAGDRAACCSLTGKVVVWDVDR